MFAYHFHSSKAEEGGGDNEDDKFANGTHFLRIVGAPGTGKSTTLKNIWGYVYQNVEALCTNICRLCNVACDCPPLVQIKERIKSSLAPERLLSFTFTNAGNVYNAP